MNIKEAEKLMSVFPYRYFKVESVTKLESGCYEILVNILRKNGDIRGFYKLVEQDSSTMIVNVEDCSEHFISDLDLIIDFEDEYDYDPRDVSQGKLLKHLEIKDDISNLSKDLYTINKGKVFLNPHGCINMVFNKNTTAVEMQWEDGSSLSMPLPRSQGHLAISSAHGRCAARLQTA